MTTPRQSDFPVGALVSARGREWVVLPPDHGFENVLRVRPLNGDQDDVAGILIHEVEGSLFEPVKESRFKYPEENDLGDAQSAWLLRQAARLTSRSVAGPMRSLGSIAFEPRSYQIVPLYVGLRHEDKVRLMIADDVGVGKTVEAGLIARELYDRGEIRSLTVLCPPHLAEQWHDELSSKFHFEDVQLILASTAKRLERKLPIGRSLFEHHPVTVVSLDYIKAKSRRDEFLRTCPDLVIVDEAHGCSDNGSKGGQQRYELLTKIAEKTEAADSKYKRHHLILVTATPHTGKHEAFCSLIKLLDKPLAADLEKTSDLTEEEEKTQRSTKSKAERKELRERLGKVFVQRRRRDIEQFLEEKTLFPTRYTASEEYSLGKETLELLLDIYKKTVSDGEGDGSNSLQIWTVINLLRTISSSPAAARATLRARLDNLLEEEQDAATIQTLKEQALDATEDDSAPSDEVPGLVLKDVEELLERIDTLIENDEDPKLEKMLDALAQMLDDGKLPIVFCRFIETARYVAEKLEAAIQNDKRFKKIKKQAPQVVCITGRLAHEEREARVTGLDPDRPRVLVCTDCLSEGINLQNYFDTVAHYDLSWSPTRHEQREGRVDRFGQARPDVFAYTLSGAQNPVDLFVKTVLSRKVEVIKKTLGVDITLVEIDNDVESTFKKIFSAHCERLDKELGDQQVDLFQLESDNTITWVEDEERGKNIKTIFRHESTQNTVDKTMRTHLERIRSEMGARGDVFDFLRRAFLRRQLEFGKPDSEGIRTIEVAGSLSPMILEALHKRGHKRLCVGDPDIETHATNRPDVIEPVRSHPSVQGLAHYIIEEALDDSVSSHEKLAARAAVTRADGITSQTYLAIYRIRYHLPPVSNARAGTPPLLVEDLLAVGFELDPASQKLHLLGEEETEALFDPRIRGNVPPELARRMLEEAKGNVRTTEVFEVLFKKVEDHAASTVEDHNALRASKRLEVRYELPKVTGANVFDLLGLYVMLPAPKI